MDTIIDIEAARALNAARVQLGEINARPFYVRDKYINPVKDLLADTLTTLCGDEERAQQLYDRLLDGVDVAEALADMRKGWIAAEFDDALTFEHNPQPVFGEFAYFAVDNERRYAVWATPESGWCLLVQDLDYPDDAESLHNLPDKWSAELVARALNAYDYGNDSRTRLTAAQDRALAAIEKHKCHGCARDAHSKGHIPKCPQATDAADYAGRVTEELQA